MIYIDRWGDTCKAKQELALNNKRHKKWKTEQAKIDACADHRWGRRKFTQRLENFIDWIICRAECIKCGFVFEGKR